MTTTYYKYHCIGKNRDGSPCSYTPKASFYCKKHEPVYPKVALKQNKDGSLSKRNKTVVKRINSFMRRRKRFHLTYDGIEYSVHHSGQMYAVKKRNQKNQRYDHIGTLLREGD